MKVKKILFAVAIGVGLFTNTRSILATDTAAVEKMPIGVSNLSDVFTIPTLSSIQSSGSSTAITNNSKVINSTNAASTGTQGVQITDALSQVGAVWSNNDAKVDLSKNWTASMWMYFGNQGTSAADGMAFVLQNTGTSAITGKMTATSGAGQTLGVWGMDTESASSASKVAAGAIQKSWALEFDEYTNGDNMSSKNGSFDRGLSVSGAHLASNYPGESTSYTRNSAADGSLFSPKYYYTLNHTGLFAATLSDGGWHHVTLKWAAPSASGTTGTMTYSLGDKNASTGMAQTAAGSTSVSIDITKLGLTASSADKSVYWGFTGSTGGSYANNVVVFEQLPGLLDASTELQVTDTTQNKTVTDGSSVGSGDELTYKYKLTHNSGSLGWKSIVAKLSQDSNISFSSGKIEYANGDVDTLSADELSNASGISHKFADNLDATNSTATLTLNGKAGNVTSDTAVKSVTQYFDGSTFVGSVATPGFTINKAPVRDLTLALSKSNASSVDKDKSINLQGYVIADADDDAITNDDVTIYTTLDNGNTIDPFKLNGTSSDNTEEGFFNLDLAAIKLSTGDNQVSFYAVDNYGNKSNTVTTTIKMNGELAFGNISNDVSFGSTKVPSQETLIKSSSDWSINVNDNRASGSKWYVYATASALKSATHTLAGNLVYVDGNGNKSSLTDTSTLISSGDSNMNTNIAADWGTEKGIFLDVQPNIYADSYTGSVTWSLADIPQD